jgi:antitoxin ChpS
MEVDMHMAKLRAVGGSVMFAIPKAILEGLHLQPNTSVGLSVSEGKLIVDPHPRPRYTLAELLAQCKPDAPRTAEDQAWLDDTHAGQEAI